MVPGLGFQDLDDGVGDLEHVDSWLQVAEHLELWGVADLDPGAEITADTAGAGAPVPQDEPLEPRGDDHGELLRDGHPEEHAAEAAAADADVGLRVVADDERERLQRGAALEQAVEVLGLDVGAADAELDEVGEDVGAGAEVLGVGERPPEAKVEAAEGGDAEDIGGGLDPYRPGMEEDEDELLDALGGEDAEPARERGGAAGARVAAGVREADAPERARVRGEDAGDGVRDARRGDWARVGGERRGDVARSEAAVVEVERDGGPDAAPAGGDRGGAGGVLGGEARDDPAEERVGEPADAVLFVQREDGGRVGGGGRRRVRVRGGEGGRREVGEDGGE
ncbi:Os01g0595725, partial [Oryza sativa Japonica Group]